MTFYVFYAGDVVTNVLKTEAGYINGNRLAAADGGLRQSEIKHASFGAAANAGAFDTPSSEAHNDNPDGEIALPPPPAPLPAPSPLPIPVASHATARAAAQKPVSAPPPAVAVSTPSVTPIVHPEGCWSIFQTMMGAADVKTFYNYLQVCNKSQAFA